MWKFNNLSKCLLLLILMVGWEPLMAQQTEPQDSPQSQLANKDETASRPPLADEQADKQTKEEEDQADKAKTEEENKPRQQARKRSRDVFKPSEEISEDLPAPFPVDI